MDSLIDQVLNTILNASIWKGLARLDNMTLLAVAVAVFVIIAIRRRR